LLKSDKLLVDELDVLKCVSRWASAECKRQEKKVSSENLRACVGVSIYELRLTSMSAEDLDTVVKGSDLISADEVSSVKAWLKADEGKKPTIKFNTTPRSGSYLVPGVIPSLISCPLL
jgi:hypothetical protein